MLNIKKREETEMKIKKFDRSTIYNAKSKDKLINIKDKDNYTEEKTSNEYATEGIIKQLKKEARSNEKMIINIGKNSAHKFGNEIGKKKLFFEKNKEQKPIREKERKIKKSNKSIKRDNRKVKKVNKKAKEKSVKDTRKNFQRARENSKKMKKAIKQALKAVKIVINAIRRALSFLILTIATCGFFLIFIIILICLIALLCSSVFGILFSREDIGESTTIDKVITELNTEFRNRIVQIQKENTYLEYELIENKAEWKDILAVYSVRVNGGNNENEVLTLNDEKISILKEIFWEMNEITYNVDGIEITDNMSYKEYIKAQLNPLTLHVNIKGKTVEEMAEKYNFNEEQRKQLAELTAEDNEYMWDAVVFGTSNGSTDIVNVAVGEIGHKGGRKYWKWYRIYKTCKLVCLFCILVCR